MVVVANRFIKHIMNVLQGHNESGSRADILGKKITPSCSAHQSTSSPKADDTFITTAQPIPGTGTKATVAGLDILKQIGLDIENTLMNAQLLLLMVHHSYVLAQWTFTFVPRKNPLK